MKRFRILCLALLMGSAAAAAGADAPIVVEKIAESRHPRHRQIGAVVFHVSLPYFDEQSRLHWNEEPVAQAGGCDGGWFAEAGQWLPRCERRTVMLGPRVDECRCTGEVGAGKVRTGIMLVGIDGRRQERWRRMAQSPMLRDGPSLVGSGSRGLIFSDMEVWSPLSGETVRTKDPAGAASFHSTHYLQERNAFLQFSGDVSVFRSKGGLYLYRPDTGTREQVLPVGLVPARSLAGYYRIADMAALPGARWILLGEEFSTRGPGDARFQVFDLERRRVVFSETFAEHHFTAEAHVISGADGNVAFSFLDETAGEYVVVHYRIRGLP